MSIETALRGVAVLCIVGLVAGCASVPSASGIVPVEMSPGTSPRSTEVEPAPSPWDYILQPGDQISVRFYYHPDHDQDVAVRPDGKVSLRGIGEIDAAQVTPSHLAKRIAALYSDLLRDPEVEVQVTRFAGQRVYVGGEVGKPGFVQLIAGMTTLQAIVEAGGLRDTARIANVVIVRRAVGPTGTRAETMLVNLEAVLEGGQLSKDVKLQPYDIVFVPKTTIAKANDFVEKYILRMLPIRPGIGLSF